MESVDDRYARGRQLRKQIPRSSHAEFKRADTVDPVQLLIDQEAGRLENLIPVRRERMGDNAFAFYRAGAKLMATDLATTPTTNLIVQASGDAHLANFGWYGSPERRLVFDANDFDETLPASFEWDLKRLAASLVIACRDNSFDASDAEKVAARGVESYRDAMLEFAGEGYLDVWYEQLSADYLLDELEKAGKNKVAKRAAKQTKKARRKDSRHVLGKLTESVDGNNRIKEDPPFIVPVRSMESEYAPDVATKFVEDGLDAYATSMPDHVAILVRRYELVDFALKVVGVGSVGTRAYIAYLQGRDKTDPLFLQIKEAMPSVLEEFFPKSVYSSHGRRVAEGQRIMQTTTDMFLGYVTSGTGRDFYVRQLKDMKASASIEEFNPHEMRTYAKACAWSLAQAHARSGDAAVLSGYMGSGDVFADAITEFAVAYADQNEADYAAFEAQTKSDDA
ncbi:MAG: DUF2252 domain-containing protein [Acidimicrobiia bacterium]